MEVQIKLVGKLGPALKAIEETLELSTDCFVSYSSWKVELGRTEKVKTFDKNLLKMHQMYNCLENFYWSLVHVKPGLSK